MKQSNDTEIQIRCFNGLILAALKLKSNKDKFEATVYLQVWCINIGTERSCIYRIVRILTFFAFDDKANGV